VDYIKEEITVILSIWKRDHLQRQLNYILNQTKKPYQIWIYQNESHLSIQIPDHIKKSFNISVIQSRDLNFKFHGRFVLPLLCDTEYVAIFDDDTMPGPRWLENCLETSRRNNCIVGANGRIVDVESSISNSACIGFGDGAPVESETEVDFVGHCWFFKAEWCKNLWKDRPFSWDNGEDIHFAAACKIYEGIRCFVPRMSHNDKRSWGDLESHLGRDDHASWKRSNHEKLRSEIIKYWCEKGWKPIISRGDE
jgi:hypothetical protein